MESLNDKQAITFLQHYEDLIANTQCKEEKAELQASKDMLLFDVSLNAICCKIGDNTKELIQAKKENNSLTLTKLHEKQKELLLLKQGIYQGDTKIMLKVLGVPMFYDFPYECFPLTLHPYIDEVLESTFQGAKPNNKNPQFYVSGGQPASGKGMAIIKAVRELESNNQSYIILNGDDFRNFHPQANEIYKEYDKEFAKHTDDFVRPLVKSMLKYAMRKRYHIIFEGTMRTDAIFYTVNEMFCAGYETHITVIATKSLYSRLAIYERYHAGIERGDLARFTSKESHDEAYENLLNVVDLLEQKAYFKSFTVLNRRGEEIYHKNISSPENNSNSAKECILQERARAIEVHPELVNIEKSICKETYFMKERKEEEKYQKDLWNLSSLCELGYTEEEMCAKEYFPHFDIIIAKGIAGQKKILQDQLANGVPLHYTNDIGDSVEELPNGRINIIEKASEIKKEEF